SGPVRTAAGPGTRHLRRVPVPHLGRAAARAARQRPQPRQDDPDLVSGSGPAPPMSPAPARMRAAYVTRHGPPSEIRIGDLPVPGIGPAEVLVAVEVVAVSAADTFVRSGQYVTPVPFPYILGRDLAG